MQEGKYVALTVRQLKPGSYDGWKEAWEGDQSDWPDFPVQAYILRNLQDENEIIAFGFFDTDEATLQSMGSDPDQAEQMQAREDAMKQFVDSIGADGIYEVVDTVTHVPSGSRELAGATA